MRFTPVFYTICARLVAELEVIFVYIVYISWWSV